MATIPDSIKATLDAQWTGAGGAEPTYYVGEDYTYTSPPPTGKEYIWIISRELKTDIKPVNDTYATVTHTLPIIVNTTTSGDRLKEICDEIARILDANPITGANYQKVINRSLNPPENLQVHRELIVVTIKTFLADSATAYGAYTVTSFDTDELTINTWLKLGRTVTAILDEDDMASDDDAALATQQSIKAYTDNELTTHTADGDAHHVKYTDAEAVTAVEAEDPLELTGELDITGAGACIDLNPAHTAGGNVISITPTAAQASGTWHGIDINGGSLDPSAATTIKGINVDLLGTSLTNNPHVTGVKIRMPNPYSGGTEYGLHVEGDGKQAQFCTDSFALSLVGNMYVINGGWMSINSADNQTFTMYNTKNDANTFFILGSGGGNAIKIRPWFNAGTQVNHHVSFTSLSASADTTHGYITFEPDSTETFRVQTAADTEQATVTGHLKVTGDLTDGTDAMTMAELADLLMFGSANAAWVPCALEGWNPTANGVVSNLGEIENVDNTNIFITYLCPKPPLFGTLKLYIAATRIHINNANATNYITNTYLEGLGTSYGKTTIDTDATAKNSAGAKTDTFGAAYDCSTYAAVKVRLQTVVADALALSVNNIEVQCYYA